MNDQKALLLIDEDRMTLYDPQTIETKCIGALCYRAKWSEQHIEHIVVCSCRQIRRYVKIADLKIHFDF